MEVKVVGTWDVEETVEVTQRCICGQLLPVTITRRVGLCRYEADGKTFLADEAIFMDFGTKLGVQSTYIKHPETPPTEAERAAGRARILEVAAQAMEEQGLWDKTA